MYAEPIKYKNEKGELEYIDNSIVAVESNGNGRQTYKNAASDVEVLISEDLGQSNAIEFKYKGYSIGFTPLNILKKNGQSSANLGFLNANGKAEKDETFDSGNKYSTVEFSNTFNEDADIRVTPTSTGLKEDIILYEIPEETEFSYELTVNKLTPLLRENGDIYFVDLDKGIIIAVIASPFMNDSSEEPETCLDIKVELEQIDKKTYKYTLIPDREYLEKAVYPVYIDPSVNTQSGGIIDTWVQSNRSYGYPNSSIIIVGRSSSGTRFRGLIQITSSGMDYIKGQLSGKTITQVNYKAYEKYTGASSPDTMVHQVTESWNSNVYWGNQPDYAATALDEVEVQAVGWYSWDITSAGKGWVAETINNNGIILKHEAENYNMYKEYYSDNNSTNKNYFEFKYLQNPTLTGSCYGNTFDPVLHPELVGTGYVNLSWNSVADATGYKVKIFNGLYYESFDVGNVTSWTSRNKKIWPTASEIASGRYTLHHDNGGTELATDPVSVYINSGGSYQSRHNYWFRVTAYNSLGETYKYANCYMPTLPDRLAPNAPSAPDVSLYNADYGAGDEVTIKVKVSSVTDLPSYDNSGIMGYEIWRTNAQGTMMGTNAVASLTPAQANGTTWIELGSTFADNDTYYYRTKAIDNLGNFSWSPTSTAVIALDRTGPTAPTFHLENNDGDTNFTIGNNYTNDVTPQIVWSGVSDISNGDSGVKRVEYSFDENTWYPIDSGDGTSSGSSQIDCSGLSDGENTVYLRGVDNCDSTGNPGTSSSVKYYKDTSPPNVSIDSPNHEDGVYGSVSITATMSDGGAAGDNFSNWKLEYGEGENPGSYTELQTGSISVSNQNIYTWDVSALKENRDYTLRLTAKDSAGNSKSDSVLLRKAYDTQSVTAQLQITNPSTSEIISDDLTVTYSDATGLSADLYVNNECVDNDDSDGLSFNVAKFENGEFVYPEGSTIYMYVHGQDANNNNSYSSVTWNTVAFTDDFDNESLIEDQDKVDQTGSIIQLEKYDATNNYSVGSFESDFKDIGGDISYIALVVDQTTPTDTGITYYYSTDGTNWSSFSPVSVDGGANTDNSNIVHFSENVNSIQIKAVLWTNVSTETPEIESWQLNVRNFSYADVQAISNDFGSAEQGITGLNDVQKSDGKMKLEWDTIYVSQGYFYSTTKKLSTNVTRVTLTTSEITDDSSDLSEYDGTSIQYQISADGGQNWQSISPGDETDINNTGKEIILKATLSTTNSNNSPELDSWNLNAVLDVDGQAYIVNLIDAPANLSAQANVNYKTLLRWDESTTTGAVYSIHRSTTENFEPTEDNVVQEGIEDNYWSDFNLDYGETYYYKVTATIDFDGHTRYSLATNEASATVVSEIEMQKKLGLQNYWGYSSFRTGSGQGYVNVSGGNLSYITTDLVIPGPFFGMVMRRTYNSQAQTETAMGTGWDYSFNTCLLKETELQFINGEWEEVVVAMILKDGDGSFHRFEGNDIDGYSSAKGTFMSLDSFASEYVIERKDGIKYHFNSKTLKLDSFSDLNGNVLNFGYDARGNVNSIENTVGDIVTLTYDSNDKLTTVTGPYGRVYSYTYHPTNGKLLEMSTTIENSVTYKEVFTYDTNNYLQTITDPENNTKSTGLYTDIEYYANGRVSKITDTSGEYYEYNYTDATPIPDGIYDNTTITRKWEDDSSTEFTGAEIEYFYNKDGLILEKADPNNNRITYTYLEDYYLVESVTYKNQDDTGYYWVKNNFVYDGSNQNITRGNITNITVQESTNGTTFSTLTVDSPETATGQSPETIIVYGDSNYPNKPTSMKIKIKDDTTDVWSETTYDYDNDTSGKLETVTITQEVSATETKETVYTYGSRNSDWGYLLEVKDDYGKVTKYVYDTDGRVTDVEEYDGTTYVRTAVEYTYDSYGRTDTITDAMGNTIDIDYDMLGRKLKETYPDPEGLYTCDYVEWSYDLNHNLESFTNRMGNTTGYDYDELDRLEKIEYPDGTYDMIAYDKWDSGTDNIVDSDKVITTSGMHETGGGMNSGSGIVSNQYYDLAGRLVQESSGTTESFTVTYEYDLIGNMISITDAAGRVSEADYDHLGRRTMTTIDPTGENMQTEYGYDLLGNMLSYIDGEDNETKYTYDYISRLESVTQPLGASSITTSYYYDLTESLDGTSYNVNKTVDAEQRETLTYFDDMGRIVAKINDGVTTDIEMVRTNYYYNDNFQPIVVERNDGTMEEYTYTALGQVKQVEYYMDVEGDGQTLTATNLINDTYTVTPDQTAKYDYYADGTVDEESLYEGTTLMHKTSYNYDVMGRVDNVQESAGFGGRYIDYSYHYQNIVSTISYTKDSTTKDIEYIFDSFGRISEVQFEGDTVRDYDYNSSNGDLEFVNTYRQFETDGTYYEDYIEMGYSYNTAGMVDVITYKDYDIDDNDGTTSNSTTETYSLDYDGRGFITDEDVTINYGTSSTTNKDFVYDELGRLKSSTIGNKTTNYTYDDVGNRLTMNDGTYLYEYDYDDEGFNLLKSIDITEISTQTTTADHTVYEYDDRGNQTLQRTKVDYNGTVKTQTTKYTFDLMNRMTMAVVSAPSELTIASINVYNVGGQRVTRTDGDWDVSTDDADSDGLFDVSEIQNTTETNYFYSGSALLYCTDGADLFTTENILDLGGSIIASKRFETSYNEYYFYNYDVRGSTSSIIDPTGTLVKGYSYDEFGNTVETTATSFNNEITYTSTIVDTSTGLQYMNARFYNPSTGRFLSQDSYTGNAYEPWTQHLYSYCGNNPTNFVDPTGHVPAWNTLETDSGGVNKEVKNENWKRDKILRVPIPKNTNEYNCAAYSAGRNDQGQVPFEGDLTTQKAVDGFIEYVGDDEDGNPMARQLDGLDDEIEDDEYIVVVSTGTNHSKLHGRTLSDYHYVVIHPETGRASHKPGGQLIVPMDIAQVTNDWDMVAYEPGTRKVIDMNEGFYDNEVMFVAVKYDSREYGIMNFEGGK